MTDIPKPLGLCPKCIETGSAGVETDTGWLVQFCEHRQVGAIYAPECGHWSIFRPCTPQELSDFIEHTKARITEAYKPAGSTVN